MELIIAHLREYAVPYLVVLVILAPTLYALRRYILPVMGWVVESALYMAALHVAVHFLVRMVRWFKFESTTYIQERVDTGWDTPLKTFWQRELYNPSWVFYVELALFAAILALVVRNRPYRMQKLTERMKANDAKKKGYSPPRPKSGVHR